MNKTDMTDPLKIYVELRGKLQQEKIQLESRLRDINHALGQTGLAPARVPALAPTPTVVRTVRGPNQASLAQMVSQVTSGHPMTKEEIIQAVQQAGYRFKTKTPVKSLNPVLYGKKPRFNRQNGKFSPAAGSASKAPAPKAGKPVKKKKRTMSPEGRARISAAAKARWAKVKAAGKKRL